MVLCDTFEYYNQHLTLLLAHALMKVLSANKVLLEKG